MRFANANANKMLKVRNLVFMIVKLFNFIIELYRLRLSVQQAMISLVETQENCKPFRSAKANGSIRLKEKTHRNHSSREYLTKLQ